MENEKSDGRCCCDSPKLRRPESLHCSTCGGKVSRKRREELNLLMLNGNAEKTCLAGGAVGRREEEKELVAVGSS